MNKNWKKTSLGELCTICMGQSPSSSTYNYSGEGVPFYQGVRDFGFKYPSPTVFCNVPKKIAEPRDVLLSVRAPIGAINVAKEKCCIGRGLAALRHKQGNSEFLFHLMRHIQKGWYAFDSQGTVFGCIGKDHISTFPIIVPKTDEEQHKIASILSAYDDLIELSERRIKILEEIARMIYKEWFVKFRFPGYEKANMVESELGMIPEGWEVRRVEEVVERIHPGKLYDSNTVKKSGNVPVLDQGRSGIIGYHDDEPGVKASEDNPVIVFANHTCYQNLILFSFSAIQNVLPFIPSKANFRNIIWLHWATKDLIRFHDYKGHWPEFVNKRLIVPSPYICDEFGKVVKPMVLQMYKLIQQNNILRQTRDMLLPKLISGEIDVSNLDIKVNQNA